MYNPYGDLGNSDNLEYKQVRVEYKRNKAYGGKNASRAVNAGGAIIIIIFVILCLTIFGLLSFMTAFADKKLADKNLNNIEQYYSADSEAEKKLAQIYNAVLSVPDMLDTTGINSALDFDASVAESDSGINVSYTTPMSDIQAISSKIEFYYNASNNKLAYKITEWKVVLTSEFDKFQYDDKNLDLYDPMGGD
ncbi:MAG: hypothetical protein FWD71_02125 [Oscillospiraceae bacterium]|nr:hypothetical protein [Oscillospiraceae bacterium]